MGGRLIGNAVIQNRKGALMFKILFSLFFFFSIILCYAQDNPEITKLYEKDQSSRKVKNINWDILLKQDSIRRVEVSKLIKSNNALTSNDFLHAAMIFQHGNDSTSYKLAWKYSNKAFQLDSTNLSARWLIAASYDRYLLSTGKPQIYGTQFLVLNNKYYLRDFDTTKVSDSTRVYYGTRTLNKIREFLNKRNGEDKGLLIVPKHLKVIVK